MSEAQYIQDGLVCVFHFFLRDKASGVTKQVGTAGASEVTPNRNLLSLRTSTNGEVPAGIPAEPYILCNLDQNPSCQTIRWRW